MSSNRLATLCLLLVLLLAALFHGSFKARDEGMISQTAHYTGYIWFKNGLSDQRLSTRKGKVLYWLLQPLMELSRFLDGPTVEQFLLARHQLIDYHLEQLIESGKISQIVEVASGLSPRGLRFCRKYGDKIRYIEADLSDMSELKRRLIGGSLSRGNHQVLDANVLLAHGEGSLGDVMSSLNRSSGTVIVTEGLVNYFDEGTVKRIWKNISNILSEFSHGTYISDIHLGRQAKSRTVRLFMMLLSVFVRGDVYLLFSDRLEAEWALIECGFLSALIHRPQDWSDEISSCGTIGAKLVHVLTASTHPKE